jgi:protein phosphatase
MEYRVNHEAMVKVFLIADGMGGLSMGEKASALAAEKWLMKLQKMTISEEFVGRSLMEQIEALKIFSYRAVQEINEEVYRELMDQGIDGGTTLTAAILFWNTLILSNCGDSPAFLWKEDGSLLRLTRDQNVAEELVRQGKISRGDQLYEQKKHMLTDYIGKYRKAEPSVLSMEYQKGEVLLLGSDGAFGSLSEDEIRGILARCKGQQDKVIESIFCRAQELGEEDNQTMIFFMEEKEENGQETSRKKGWFWKRRAV